jgi:outer membrane receptor protein involved in Fe transport
MEYVRLSWRQRVIAGALLWALAAAAPAPAAAQTSTGAIVGIVTDAQGQVLPGVTLAVRNADTGVSRTSVSEGDGRYRIAGLPPGRYDVKAELPGFASAEAKELTLTIGLELQRDLTLGLENLQEAVTVRGPSALVEPTKSEVAAVVTQKQIDTLPVEGRSAITLSLLLPGTGTDTTRARRPGANIGVGGISTAGTNYIVDGMNNMISRAGDAREDIPQGAIQEFKVIVSQAPAEYGGRVGGVVNVVTKSGTNQFSGQAFEYFRDKSLNRVDRYQQAAQDTLGASKPDFRRNQFGAAVGGPVLQNRVHFFGSFERTKQDEFFTVSTGKPQFYSALEGTFPGGNDATSYFGRGDVQLTPAQHLFVRYYKQESNYFCDGCGGNNAAFSAGDAGVPGHSYIAGHTWVISPRVLNEFTVMNAHSYQTGDLSQYTPAQFLAAGGSAVYRFPSLTWGGSGGSYFDNSYRQFRNALSISAGAHTVKVGVGAQWLPTYQYNPGSPLGTWTFTTDQYFNPEDPAFNFSSLTAPSQFTASLPAYEPRNLSHTYEAYVQDEWRPWSNLTLNLGLRYDLQTKIWNENFSQDRYPRPLPYVDFASRGDKNNIGPRLGFAWDVTRDARTLVRGGYGVIYTNVQNSLLDGEITAFQQYSVNIRNPSYPDPYQGRDPLSFVSTSAPNITIGANNLVNAPAQTVNGGVSRVLSDHLALHVDGVYTRIDDFPNRVNVNTPDPATGVRPLPAWGQIVQLQPSQGAFEYRALFVRLDRRFADRYQYTVSYTLSKQENAWTGTSANSNGSITNIFDRSLDQGPADNDRRHGVTASGSFLLPYDITLGAIWTYRSSAPFSALAGTDLNGDGFNTDYVPGTTRNQGNRNLDLSAVNAWRATRGLAAISADQIDSNRYSRLDVRVSKAIPLGGSRRVDLIAQVFSLLGTDNLGGVGTSWVTNATSDSFGRILTALPRQQGELAVRFVF